MRLGLLLGYSGAKISIPFDLVMEAEALGFDSVWTSEAYGSDAVAPLAWIGARTTKIKLGTAIVQMPARTPTMTGMTAMTLDGLSGGRFILGLGPSGPQVVEGWYGVPYGSALVRTREYIAILRKIFARDEPLQFSGSEYTIPYLGPGATGLGKPLKSILHSRRDIPIYTGAIAPKSLALSAEIADGLIPMWLNPERFDTIAPHLDEGFRRPGARKSLRDFEIAPFVHCTVGEDLDRCRLPVKQMLALYIGGMGARRKNFYYTYAQQMGYEAEARRIQDLYLSGKKTEAVGAVPDRLVDEIALVGPPGRIAERLAAWQASPIRAMLISTTQVEALRMLAELCL